MSTVVCLAGLTVSPTARRSLMTRFRQRAAGTSVRLLTREQIHRSGVASAEQFVIQRAHLVLCPSAIVSDGRSNPTGAAVAKLAAEAARDFRIPACVRSRGRTVPVKVYLNDRLTSAGILELITYHTSDVYAVEIRDAGREVRVFTTTFMQRVAEGREQLHRIPPQR